jgi:hypothetical protein
MLKSARALIFGVDGTLFPSRPWREAAKKPYFCIAATAPIPENRLKRGILEKVTVGSESTCPGPRERVFF